MKLESVYRKKYEYNSKWFEWSNKECLQMAEHEQEQEQERTRGARAEDVHKVFLTFSI